MVTTKKLRSRVSHLICSHCFVHCAAHKEKITLWRHVTYYGYRRCRQSHDFIDCDGEVIAVLGAGSALSYQLEGGQLRVNWFAHGEPFDFDRVEIIRASDEDVERFIAKIGNDADPLRQPRYQ